MTVVDQLPSCMWTIVTFSAGVGFTFCKPVHAGLGVRVEKHFTEVCLPLFCSDEPTTAVGSAAKQLG